MIIGPMETNARIDSRHDVYKHMTKPPTNEMPDDNNVANDVCTG